MPSWRFIAVFIRYWDFFEPKTATAERQRAENAMGRFALPYDKTKEEAQL